MKTNRRGIPFFADFYCFTERWNPDDPTHTGRARIILEHTRKVLLKEVSWCVVSELYHHRHQVIRYPKKVTRCGCYICNHRGPCARRHAEAARKMRGLFHKAKRWFLDGTWAIAYGGPPWALIAERAQILEDHQDFSVSGMRSLMVKIDMVIDSVHNCGPCLDKLHVGMSNFLYWKTNANISKGLYRLAQPFCRMIG